ncbi:class I SAM-dependent methyltransferase [Paraburkholderia sp. CNPSo 3274]|uniref:SAM-dependent methyltransferase n=1 Tax=Paraburkholderia sp. CNPSo 3274 TaxID=2940932 RepID=UPI002816457E|nr:class I SAM-dependent methyltransferase [Paraburkholderia sp. CNPSo 3274]
MRLDAGYNAEYRSAASHDRNSASSRPCVTDSHSVNVTIDRLTSGQNGANEKSALRKGDSVTGDPPLRCEQIASCPPELPTNRRGFDESQNNEDLHEPGDEDLATAQLKKNDHILAQGRPDAARHRLRLGALVLRAAQKFGARCVGVTLSQNQFDLATARVKVAGLEDRIEIRLQD